MKDKDGKPIYGFSKLHSYVDGPDSPAGVAATLHAQGMFKCDIAGQLSKRFKLEFRVRDITELINLYKETP